VVEQVRLVEAGSGGDLGDGAFGGGLLDAVSTLPVPPPLTNSRSVRRRTAATTAARRRASSRPERRCMTWMARARTGRPGGRSPTPAICPS